MAMSEREDLARIARLAFTRWIHPSVPEVGGFIFDQIAEAIIAAGYARHPIEPPTEDR